jgi:hypothetical protein
LRFGRVAAAAMMCLAAGGCGERRAASSPALTPAPARFPASLAIYPKARAMDHPIAVMTVDKIIGWGS